MEKFDELIETLESISGYSVNTDTAFIDLDLSDADYDALQEFVSSTFTIDLDFDVVCLDTVQELLDYLSESCE